MLITSGNSQIIVSTGIRDIIEEVLFRNGFDKLFILMDENSEKHCFPLLRDIKQFGKAEIIIIQSGEKNKNIKSLEKIWGYLSDNGATRSSLLINIGGGVICDMGGFAASTFKRGMQFMNVPTTLLSQVDASMGGKTGVNFQKLKNEIGVFSNPDHVFIDSTFLKTLENRHILSGWAEMMKHSLIFSEEDWNELIKERVQNISYQRLKLIQTLQNTKAHYSTAHKSLSYHLKVDTFSQKEYQKYGSSENIVYFPEYLVRHKTGPLQTSIPQSPLQLRSQAYYKNYFRESTTSTLPSRLAYKLNFGHSITGCTVLYLTQFS